MAVLVFADSFGWSALDEPIKTQRSSVPLRHFSLVLDGHRGYDRQTASSTPKAAFKGLDVNFDYVGILAGLPAENP